MLCAMDVASVTFLPARRYASAGTGYDPVSVTSRCSIETDMRIELVFLRGGFFRLRPILNDVTRKFRYLEK